MLYFLLREHCDVYTEVHFEEKQEKLAFAA